MEDLLEQLQGLNVNIDTTSLVEIARYWFWKDILINISIPLTITIMLVIGAKVWRNTFEWYKKKEEDWK